MIYAFRPVNLLSLVCLFAHFCIVPYHNMDNLLSLSREGDITSSLKGIVDNLSMTYDGNMLASVSDSAPAPSVTGSADFRDGVSEVVEYTYDRNGNMTSDLNRKVSLISYNRQNRPARMRHAGGTETFTYLPDGTKRGRTVLGKDRSLSRTEYRGNLVCADDTLKYILFDGGLIAMDGASPEYLFFLRDHLGSVRVVARSDGKVVQVNHYYPYGMAYASGRMSGNAEAHPVTGEGGNVIDGDLEIGGGTGGMELARPGASQPYRFLGNELYTSNSLGLYDFSARMYDPSLGRFLSVDPMAETCLNMTPFAYCGNNPIIRVDPEGEIWHIVGGAVVGAVLEGGSALIQGKTGKEIGAAAVRGAIEGGVVAATGGAGLMVGIISNAGASVVGSAVEQVIANDGDIDVKVVGRDALVSGGLSLVTGKTSEALKKAVEKTVSNPSFKQTVKKSVTDEFKTLGRKESKSTIDRVVENKVRQITKEETKNVEYLINFSNYSALATSGYIFNNE